MSSLSRHRILLCGKGGSGKSSVTALLAQALQSRGHAVVLLDGDASNPGGLVRLVLGPTDGPAPLFEFFGGREKVTCPVDDPSPLKRPSDDRPVASARISIADIPQRYYARADGLLLFQVGKILRPYEGCDGPMSKVTRDFILDGEFVTVIDVEAGIEHFGRGIETHMTAVLVVVDPTFESFEVAARVRALSAEMRIRHALAILNAVDGPETEASMRAALALRGVPVLGKIRFDPSVRAAGLKGESIGPCDAARDTAVLAHALEQILSPGGAGG